jgi:hypothetical protein
MHTSTITTVLALWITQSLAFDVIRPTPEMTYWNDFGTPFSAIYNGSLSLLITTIGRPSCDGLGETVGNYSIQIGPVDKVKKGQAFIQKNGYDDNPFWFDLRGPSGVVNSTWTMLTSSQGGYNSTSNSTQGDVYWNISSTAAGDGWDLKGKHALTTVEYNRFSLNACINNLRNWKYYSEEGWTMTGHLSPAKIDLAWSKSFVERGSTGSTWKFSFTGDWDPDTPKLVGGGASPKIEGYNKRIAKTEGKTVAGTSAGNMLQRSSLMGVMLVAFGSAFTLI